MGTGEYSFSPAKLKSLKLAALLCKQYITDKFNRHIGIFKSDFPDLRPICYLQGNCSAFCFRGLFGLFIQVFVYADSYTL